MTILPGEVRAVRDAADQLHSAADVAVALDAMAEAITERLDGHDPLVLVVMNGGMIPAAQLLTRLDFPLQIGYLHATRYRGATRGGTLDWVVPPSQPVAGRVVLVIDDIFDEGLTLRAILDQLRADGAAEVLSAVLINKLHDRKAPGLEIDFVGLTVPDRYVFGCGMDYKEYLRNLPGIYAVANQAPGAGSDTA